MNKQITFLADEITQAKLAYIDCWYHRGGLCKKKSTKSATLRAAIDSVYSQIAGNSNAYEQFLTRK
ncbi:hypothetical protein [Ligilactobacillus salivarius]|uniref:hypothetical protein n=1 Tax=Ligilactobacillus salivarius TaxID=1624 RepID=UPI002966C521|nr:hypothetical protein [Ligilactobacillus salivarius]MDW3023978.1 hypothetical protein [Ligilactobacillus salivarius]